MPLDAITIGTNMRYEAWHIMLIPIILYYISNNTGDWWGVSPEQLKLINQFYLDSVKNKRLRECNGTLSILTSDGLWRKILCIPKSSQLEHK
jgi:hypothetical protein